jgi:hypothetical protein
MDEIPVSKDDPDNYYATFRQILCDLKRAGVIRKTFMKRYAVETPTVTHNKPHRASKVSVKDRKRPPLKLIPAKRKVTNNGPDVSRAFLNVKPKFHK